MSKPETIIMTAIKQELQSLTSNAVIDAFREGLCTAAEMVRVCATNDFLKKQLRDRPEITLKAIADAIEATSPKPPGGTP